MSPAIEPAADRASASAPPTSAQNATAAPETDEGEFGAQSLGYVLVRWITYLGLLGVIGVFVFRAAVLRRIRRRSPGDATVTAFVHRAFVLSRAWAIGAAVLLLIGVGLRLLAQLRAVYGDMAGDAGLTSALLGSTAWGWAWVTQAVAATVALVVVAVWRRPASPAQGSGALEIIGGLAVVALAAAAAASGHPAAAHPAALAVTSDAVHMVAAGGWIGTLALVALAGIPAAAAADSIVAEPARPADGALAPTSSAALVRSLILEFSNIALVCVATIVLTGVISAWIEIRSVVALWATPYGQVLLVKLAFVALVAAAGAYNWRVATPRLLDSGGVRRIRGAIATELAFAVGVIAATAVLVATPPPMDAMVVEQPEVRDALLRPGKPQ